MSDLLVLCYHALSPRWPAALSLPPDAFERGLRRLADRGYSGITFTEAVSSPPRGRAVVVTFDDAFGSVGNLAEPVLTELGWPATVFVPTDFPAECRLLAWEGTSQWAGGEFSDELKPMDWTEIAALQSRGWEIGSHTCSHPYLTRLDDQRLASELVRSRAVCEERLGGRCASIAYPYGDVDARVEAAAAEAGYTVGAALPRRLGAGSLLAWPRVGVYNGDDGWRFAVKVSRGVRRLRASGAWVAVEAARRGVRR